MNNYILIPLLGLSFYLCAFDSLQAAEVDSFSGGQKNLEDSLPIVNEWVIAELEAAADATNKKSRVMANRRHPKTRRLVHPPNRGVTYCNSSLLYQELTSRLAQSLVGQLEIFAEESDQVDRRQVPFVDSIYRDFMLSETPSITSSERVSSIINVGGVYIGTDKLGHFLTEGHTYYKRADLDHEGLEGALDFGVFTESLYFGALTTGVFSYADLVANYHGYHFWHRLMSEGEDSYIQCADENWVVAKEFSFREHIDEGWDETVNCSLFRNEILLTKVQLRLQGRVCGGSSHVYERLKQRYMEHYSKLINDSGHRLLPDELSPDRVLERYLADEELGPIAQSALQRSQAIYQEWERNNTEKR